MNPEEHVILLVDDDPAILELLRLALAQINYSVLTAGSGEEALRLAGKLNGDIDLLITDVQMPGMDGPQLYENLIRQNPAVGVLYISAAPALLEMAHSSLPLLAKPFHLDTFRERVRVALSSRLATASPRPL